MCDGADFLGSMPGDAGIPLAMNSMNKKGSRKPSYETRLTRKEVAQGRALMKTYQTLYPDTLKLAQQSSQDYGDLYRKASDQARAHDFEAFAQYAPQYRQTIMDADPARAALLQQSNDVAGQYLSASSDPLGHVNDPMSSAARREIIQASFGNSALAGFGNSARDAALAYVSTGLTGEQLRQQRLDQALQTYSAGSRGSAAALDANQRAIGDPFLAITGRPAMPQGANIQSPDYTGFNNDLFSYGVNREIMDNNNAQAQAARQAQLIGAGISAVGSIGGGAMKAICPMALQVWTQDQGPALTLAGGQAIANGVASLGASLGQGLSAMMEARERKIEQLKQLAGNAKAADIAFKNNPDLFGGTPPEQWATLSAQDKVGAFAGAVTSATLQHQQAQLDKMSQDAAAGREFTGFARQYAAGPSGALGPNTLDRFGAALSQPPAPMADNFGLDAAMSPAPSQPGAVGEDSPMASFRAALAQHPGAVNSPQFDNFTRALAGLEAVPSSGEPTAPNVTKLPGGYYSYGFRGTKQRGVYPDMSGQPTQFPGQEGLYVQPKGSTLFQPRQDRNPVPESFHKVMDQATEDIGLARATLADPKASADRKASSQRMLAAARQRAAATISRYHGTGVLTDDQRDQFMAEIGDGAEGSPGAAPAAGGSGKFDFVPGQGLKPKR